MARPDDRFPDPINWEPIIEISANWEDDEFLWAIEEPELNPTRPSDRDLINGDEL